MKRELSLEAISTLFRGMSDAKLMRAGVVVVAELAGDQAGSAVRAGMWSGEVLRRGEDARAGDQSKRLIRDLKDEVETQRRKARQPWRVQ